MFGADFPGWPDTAHPEYQDDASWIRALMADGRHDVMYAAGHVPATIARGDEPEPELRVLVVRQAYGFAPWTGSPFVYVWEVAVDQDLRWVAGPARIQRLDPDVFHVELTEEWVDPDPGQA